MPNHFSPLFSLLTLLAAVAIPPVHAEAATKPNIVVIVADDLGFSDVGFNGSKQIRTPNLDQFAATGVRLDRFYACPVCSPTRAGLLTGRWPIRYGLMKTVVPPWSNYGLPPVETTIPEMLADAGYNRRGIIGKWHLGHARKELLPLAQGFTEFYGHYNGAIDYFTHEREGEHDWHRNRETVREEGYSTDLLAQEAIRFIEASPTEEPYFLYVPFNAPHSPFQAVEGDLARHPNLKGNRRTYVAMVERLDQGIGQILKSIESRPDAENTFVLFFSDNGGHVPPARNEPFRDGKFSVYEGGIRVAAAVRWPAGGLAGGRVCTEPMGYVDIFPTVQSLAGNEAGSTEMQLDGIDVLEVLQGKKSTPERPWFSYIAPAETERASVILGDWKLVSVGADVFTSSADTDTRRELYNLATDPQEENDLAAKHPDRVAELNQKLIEFGKLQPADGVAPYAEGRKGFKAPKDWVVR